MTQKRSKSFRKNKKWNKNSMVKIFSRDFLFHMFIENLWFLTIRNLFPSLLRYLMNETIMQRRGLIQNILYWMSMKSVMFSKTTSMRNLWKIIFISEEFLTRNINHSILLTTRLTGQLELKNYSEKKWKLHGSNWPKKRPNLNLLSKGSNLVVLHDYSETYGLNTINYLYNFVEVVSTIDKKFWHLNIIR